MIGRLALLLVALLPLLETGLATARSDAAEPSLAQARAPSGQAPAGGSLTEAVRFVRGREISPSALMVGLVGLGLFAQAFRLFGGRALPVVRGVTTLLVFLFLWELTVSLRLVTTILLPPPTLVLYKLDVLWLNDYLHWHFLSTLRRFLLSFGVAVATALPLGVVLANFSRTFVLLHPVITFVRMIPAPAWAPLSILWLGLGDPPAIFIVWLAVFFPIFLNTIRGIHDTLPVYREVVRVLGGSRWDEILQATVPCALPAIFAGIRIGFGLGWVVLATAELIAVDSGLGWIIHAAYTQVDSPGVLAGMTLICWTGVLMDLALRQLERRFVS